MIPRTVHYAIRPAVASDIDDLLRLIRGIAEFTNRAHEVEATRERLHQSLFGDRAVARAFIASIGNGEAVGYAVFFHNFSTFLGKPGIYLEDLYVDANYRGRGIGKALFRAVAQIAHDEGCSRMEWLALEDNAPALEFYRTQGAEKLKAPRVHRLCRERIKGLVNSGDPP